MKTWVVGDLHGCYDEYKEMLELLDYKSPNVRIILAGDQIDRGPNSLGCIRLSRELNIECVLANHEQKYLKWLNNKNTSNNYVKKQPHYEQFSSDDIEYIRRMPLYIKLPEFNTVIVHAGVKKHIPIEKQTVDDLCYTRFLDEHNRFLSMRKIYKAGSLEAAKGHFWTEHGPFGFNVIYGHMVFDEPRIDVFPNGEKCIGLDCGVVFGNKLCAYSPTTDEFVFVKAKQTYYRSTMANLL